MLGRRTGSSPSERAAFLPAGRRALSLEAGFQPDPASSHPAIQSVNPAHPAAGCLGRGWIQPSSPGLGYVYGDWIQQPSLSRKERQQAYLVRDLVAELEHKHGTNTVHAINFSFGKRSTSVSIVLNRERGIQDTHGQHEVADGPPAAWITIQSGQTTSFACSNAMAFGWTGRHTAQTASQFSS